MLEELCPGSARESPDCAELITLEGDETSEIKRVVQEAKKWLAWATAKLSGR